jgi:hypothetical protein
MIDPSNSGNNTTITYTPEQEELLISKARESLIMHLQVLIRAMAALKVPFTTKEAMTCAQSLLKVGVNRVWKDDLKDSIRTLWNDKGVQHTYNLRGSKYKLDDEEIANHLFESIERIISVDFKPNGLDMKMFCPNLKQLIPDPVVVVNNGGNNFVESNNNVRKDYTDEDLDFTRAFFFETIIATMKVLIRAAASLRQPIGTKLAMEYAQKIFMIPDDNMEWNEDVANMIKVVWDDTGIKETYNRRGDAYTLEDPETIVYICDNISRFLDYNYVPSKEDVEKAILWTTVPGDDDQIDIMQNMQPNTQPNTQNNVNSTTIQNAIQSTQTNTQNTQINTNTQTNQTNTQTNQTNIQSNPTNIQSNQTNTQTNTQNTQNNTQYTQTNVGQNTVSQTSPTVQTNTQVQTNIQSNTVETQNNLQNNNTQTNVQTNVQSNNNVQNNNQTNIQTNNNVQQDNNNPQEEQRFSNEDKRTVKPVIQDTLFLELKAVIINAAHTRTPFGSQETLNLARTLLSIPEENIKWTSDVQILVEKLWSDTGIQTVYKIGNVNYFLDNLARMCKVDFFSIR